MGIGEPVLADMPDEVANLECLKIAIVVKAATHMVVVKTAESRVHIAVHVAKPKISLTCDQFASGAGAVHEWPELRQDQCWHISMRAFLQVRFIQAELPSFGVLEQLRPRISDEAAGRMAANEQIDYLLHLVGLVLDWFFHGSKSPDNLVPRMICAGVGVGKGSKGWPN